MRLTTFSRRVPRLLGGWSGVLSIGVAVAAFGAWLAFQRWMNPTPVTNPSGTFGLWVKPLPNDTLAMPIFIAARVTDPVAPLTVSQVNAGLKNVFLDRGLEVTEAPYDSIGEPVPHTRIVFDIEKTGSYVIQNYVHCPIQIFTRTGGRRVGYQDEMTSYAEASAFDSVTLRTFVQGQVGNVSGNRCLPSK